MRILVVEDDPGDVELLLCCLEDSEIKPEYRVVNNKEAIKEALYESDWDIILSDFVMPSMDGFDVICIRDEISPVTPVIILSGK